MAGPGDLHALAQAWLAACVATLDTVHTADATLLGAPERRFVSVGPPALDCCDQLAVHVALLSEKDTTPGGLSAGRRVPQGAWLNEVDLVATATRCVPGPTSAGDPPTAAALEESSRQINADGWALWNHLHNLIVAGHLLTICGSVFFQGISVLPPSGGCAGWVVRIRVTYDGYDEVIGT